ncbi:MAG: hypothetical protein ACOC57_06150, partial [Acidobacteriota bacterium]
MSIPRKKGPLFLFALTALFLLLSSCRKKEESIQYEILLDDGWFIQSSEKIKEKGDIISGPVFNAAEWYEASVPTTVLA